MSRDLEGFLYQLRIPATVKVVEMVGCIMIVFISYSLYSIYLRI